MDNLVNELVQVLDQEARVYDDILRISKNKTNIIVQGKVSELESITKLEQSLVLQIGRLEDLREGLTKKLSDALGIKMSEVTVSELVKHIGGEQAGKLKDCQGRITGVVNELKNTNELNSKLIKNSLEYINFSINIFANADMGSNNYGNTGQVNDSKKRNLFDMKL